MDNISHQIQVMAPDQSRDGIHNNWRVTGGKC
jgi:hypothetical protein